MKRVLSLLLVTMGCGGPKPTTIYGIDFFAPPEIDLDRARLKRVVEVASQKWGVPILLYAGYTVSFTLTPVACGIERSVAGCTFLKDIEVWAQVPDCLEASSLLHELGHASIGDPLHLDPRWRDTAAEWRELVEGPNAHPDCWTKDW